MSTRLLLLTPLAFLTIHAQTVRMDDPRNTERLNREIWESVKHTPYSKAVQYAAAAQKNSRAANALATLPTGWSIGPAGTQVSVGRLPFDAVTFNGSVVVMDTGYSSQAQDFMVVDPGAGQATNTISVQNLFPGAAAGPGNSLYVSGGASNVVYRYDSQYHLAATYNLPGYAHGLANYDATRIAATYSEKPGGGGITRASHVVLIDTTTGRIAGDTLIANQEPYALATVSGKIYATMPDLNEAIVLDQGLHMVATVGVGLTPLNTCQDSSLLFVVNSNADSVSVINTQNDQVTNTFTIPFLNQNWGGEAVSCAVDETNLYVAMAQLNAVAVLNKNDGSFQGYIPTGWYPTKVLNLGNQLMVVSAKGIQPRRPNDANGEYVLNLLQGTVGLVNKSDIAANLAAWTLQVKASIPLAELAASMTAGIRHVFFIVKENRTYDQVLGDLGEGNGDPELTVFGDTVTPIQHYLASSFVDLDNLFVDGEVSTTGHSVTSSGYASPYLQMLTSLDYSGRLDGSSAVDPGGFARSYLWDVMKSAKVGYRIYGESEYLQDLEKLISQTYGPQSPLAASLGYLSDPDEQLSRVCAQLTTLFSGHLQDAGTVSGLQALLANPQFGQSFSQILVGDNSLYTAMLQNPGFFAAVVEFFSHWQFTYAPFDLNISDLTRISAWLTDFQTRDQQNRVEPFNYLILPNDHTGGPLTPVQDVAQNDAALDIFLRALSQSKVWSQSLVLVVEDDAQDGLDHVDATRTTGFAISPWVKRNTVVSSRYDQASMIRTIGLLLGVSPVSLNDGLATPMFDIFSGQSAPGYNPPPVSNQLAPADAQLYQQLLNQLQ